MAAQDGAPGTYVRGGVSQGRRGCPRPGAPGGWGEERAQMRSVGNRSCGGREPVDVMIDCEMAEGDCWSGLDVIDVMVVAVCTDDEFE